MTSIKHIDELDFYLHSYDYQLDTSLIASRPTEVRHKSRMMIVRNSLSSQNCSTNKLTLDIVDEINSGDLVIVNDTKVMKARLRIELDNGSQLELLVL